MLPIRGRNEDDVSPAHLATLQAVFGFCKYLIIDEKSMAGLKQMGWIDRWLRQYFLCKRISLLVELASSCAVTFINYHQ
jgi:hypothetical protein